MAVRRKHISLIVKQMLTTHRITALLSLLKPSPLLLAQRFVKSLPRMTYQGSFTGIANGDLP